MIRLLSVVVMLTAACLLLSATGCTNTATKKDKGATTKKTEEVTTQKGSGEPTTKKTEEPTTKKTEEPTTKKEEGTTKKTEETTKKGARLTLPISEDYLALNSSLGNGDQYARGCRGGRRGHGRSRGARGGCC